MLHGDLCQRTEIFYGGKCQKRDCTVWNKGKYRLVVLPEKLCVKLEKYIVDRKLQSGMVFVTRNGKPVDRSNIWREMKKLAELEK